MKFLNPDHLNFEKRKSGYLTLTRTSKKSYKNIGAAPLFPLSRPEQFVSIFSYDNEAPEELGIIEDLSLLNPGQRQLIKDDIEFRYFTPEILDIKRIDSRYRMQEWDVVTAHGPKVFFVKEIRENIIFRENGHILITDLDKSRFQIRDFRKLPPRAIRELELNLL